MTREQPDRPTREIQEEVNKEFGPDVTRAGYGACTLRRRKLRISASNTARRSIGPKPLLNRSTESLVPKPLSGVDRDDCSQALIVTNVIKRLS